MDAEAPARDRAQANQRACRHHQLRHLRSRPAAACVRLRQGRGRPDTCGARVQGESVLALDGKTYALDESMVVIADAQRRRIDRRDHGRRALRLRREYARRADRERAVGPDQYRAHRPQARCSHRRALPVRARRRSRLLRSRLRPRDRARPRPLRRRAFADDRRGRSFGASPRSSNFLTPRSSG